MKTQGFILLDVDAVALNNAGKSTASNFDNAVATKKIVKNGRSYVYVSGQAWRYWWRNTLQQNFGWELSPITRESKIAFTEANPAKYPDDDIFGYMRAVKETVKDEETGKEKKVDATVTRISPLKNSVIVSAGSVKVSENWSSMARQEGDSVPYSKEEYSGILKGMFSLDLEQVGTFSNYNKTGFKNITEKHKSEILENGGNEIEDKFLKNKDGKPHKLVRLADSTRLKRITDTISALKTISGGAMQTDNMGDVTPKFIILSTMTTGNHPFSHVVKNDGINNEKVLLNIDGIKEILKDYKEQIQGTVFIGIRSGFFDEYRNDLANLKELSNDYATIKFGSVNEAIDGYCEEIKQFIS